MIDTDNEIRKLMGLNCTTSNVAEEQEPLTLEKLREAMKSLPQQPIPLRTSKHVPALGTVPRKLFPKTDDMRKMCEDIGPQSVNVAYVLDTPFGKTAFANPIHFKSQSVDGTVEQREETLVREFVKILKGTSCASPELVERVSTMTYEGIRDQNDIRT